MKCFCSQFIYHLVFCLNYSSVSGEAPNLVHYTLTPPVMPIKKIVSTVVEYVRLTKSLCVLLLSSKCQATSPEIIILEMQWHL